MKTKKIRMKLNYFMFTVIALIVVGFFLSNDKDGSSLADRGGDYNPERNYSLVKKLEIPCQSLSKSDTIMYRKAYTVNYNKDLLIPNWVAWCLTSDHVYGTVKRCSSNAFRADDVPFPRATREDYYKSGWSRGHMFPAGDGRWDAEVMYESFLLTNVCPQDGVLNSGDWEEIESLCRLWAECYGKVYIVCGPLFRSNDYRTIGGNGVAVPDAFFKVVLALNPEPKAIAFVCDNVKCNKLLGSYVKTVDYVEKITNTDFFYSLDDKIEDKIEAESDLESWNTSVR